MAAAEMDRGCAGVESVRWRAEWCKMGRARSCEVYSRLWAGRAAQGGVDRLAIVCLSVCWRVERRQEKK